VAVVVRRCGRRGFRDLYLVFLEILVVVVVVVVVYRRLLVFVNLQREELSVNLKVQLVVVVVVVKGSSSSLFKISSVWVTRF
jgi:hypothetical protein